MAIFVIGDRDVKIREKYSPLDIGDISTVSMEEWADHWRPHGSGWDDPRPDNPKYLKLAIGGSDTSVIAGCSKFKNVLEFWAEKTGRMTNKFSTAATKRGHLYEFVTIQKYCQIRQDDGDENFKVLADGKILNASGEIVLDENKNPVKEPYSMTMFRDGRKNADGTFKYPWALANCDAFVVENGEIGGLEIKTTADMGAAYGEWSKGVIPPYYLTQIVYYMAILNLRWWDICCSWGQEYRDTAIIRFYRDYELEDWLFSKIEEFVSYVEADIEPPVENGNPEYLIRYCYNKFGASKEDKPMVDLPEKYAGYMVKALDLEKKIDELNAKVKELTDERFKVLYEIYNVMGDTAYGQVKLSDTELCSIKIKTPKKRDGFNEEGLKNDHPDIYKKYVTETFDVSAFKKDKANAALKNKYTVPGGPNTDPDAYQKIKFELAVKNLR